MVCISQFTDDEMRYAARDIKASQELLTWLGSGLVFSPGHLSPVGLL